jgi:hypothetical protein
MRVLIALAGDDALARCVIGERAGQTLGRPYIGQLCPGIPIPCPGANRRLLLRTRALHRAALEKRQTTRAVVRHFEQAIESVRSGVIDLRPKFAVPFPRLPSGVGVVAPEKDGDVADRIESELHEYRRRRSRVGHLHPVFSIPLPGVAEPRRVVLTAPEKTPGRAVRLKRPAHAA